jgi:hypothetical protein
MLVVFVLVVVTLLGHQPIAVLSCVGAALAGAAKPVTAKTAAMSRVAANFFIRYALSFRCEFVACDLNKVTGQTIRAFLLQ